jgi:Tol biopolymer transport system component
LSRPLRRGIWLAVLIAALAAPGAAWAHGGGTFTAPNGTAPTIDGVLNASEWSDAIAYPLIFGTRNATVRFKHDATYMYAGVVVQDPTPGTNPSLDIFFDNNHDGLKNTGDDVWLAFAPGGGSDFFFSPTGTGGASHYNDLVNPANGSLSGGTNDTLAAATSTPGQVVFEFRHPLCSADTTHDICTSTGQTLGVDFQYEPGSGGFFNAPGTNLFNPSAGWADLVVSSADTTPPSVTLTQPSAGTILRGPVDVAATASDNVGVSRVDFTYVGRLSPGGDLVNTPIGSDATAPYSVSFDTTTVPNTLIKDAMIEATAYDGANNSADSVQNAVTIDNTQPGSIVFESDRDGNSEIWSMDPDGGDAKRLTNTSAPVVNTRPSLSPNGNLVAFESTSGGTRQVWVMNAADGTNLHPLTTAAQGSNGAPAFSPDGGKIAFETNRDGNWEIYVMNADGSAPSGVTNDPAADVSASWSPDGAKLAFDSTRSGNRDIWTINVDGTGVPQNLTASNLSLDADPDWSPDGQKILFVSQRAATSVWTMNADGTNQQNISSATGYDADPTWAPDGQHIAFVRDAGGTNFNVWTARPTIQGIFGNAQLQLTHAENFNCLGYTVSDVLSKTYVIQPPSYGSNCAITQDRSILGITPSAITFQNHSGVTADVYWLDYNGNRVHYATLASGQSYTQPTWLTHPWVMIGQGLPSGSARNSFPDWGPLPSHATSATISINGPSTSLPGAQSVPISGISLDAIRGTTQTNAAAPLGGIALGGIPLGGIALGGIPLGGIALGGIGFTAANLSQNGLGGVPLSTIPLKPSDPPNPLDRWETRLAGTTFAGTPLQNVTLGQIIDTPAVAGVTLAKLDLSSSALGGIPLAGIALGGIPLGGIALGGIALGGISTTDQNLTAWCDYINSQRGYAGTCSDGTSLAGKTMMDLALGGIPLGGIALGGIPLGGIALGGIALGGIPVGTALGGIPLGGINLTGTALGGIALGGIDFSVSPLGGIPLGGIALGGIALGGIPLAGISATAQSVIFTCGTTCPDRTLADAASNRHILPGATLGQLGTYTDANGNPIRIEDIGYYCLPGTPTDTTACRSTDTPILLKDFIKGLPAGTTLADLLATLLSVTAYDWEALPFATFPLQDFSSDGGVVTYHVPFAVGGAGSLTSARIAVFLPTGARYKAGSTTVNAPLSIGEPTLFSGNELIWDVSGIPFGAANELTFQARPGLALGTESATAKIGVSGLASQLSARPASTQITPTFAGYDTAGNAAPIQKNTLYLGYTPNGSARSYFKIPVPAAGTQVTVHLSHLHVDDDVVVFGPTAAPLRNPAGHVTPLGGQQAADVPYSLQQKTQVITPVAQSDVPQALTGQQVLGVSDNRGLADEEVSVGTPEDTLPGTFLTIQVTSYDGGYSDQPWQLRVEETPPPTLPPTCSQPAANGVGTAGTMPTIPTTASTLYLINAKRYGNLYGAAAESNVLAKLRTLALRSDAAGGAVIPVESYPSVNSAYNLWTDPANPTNYCSPGRANDVVRAIGGMLDSIVPASVKYIVVVGDDPVIPYGRIIDNTSFANEHGYATTFLGGDNNEYLSTYGLGFLPSDDPYGDNNYTGSGPYVPELAVSRLVETPADIIAQVDRYISRNGAVAPTRSVVAGYDFLTDGSQAIAASLRNDLGTNSTQTPLIREDWAKSDLLSALFPGTAAPEIDSINAHFDHNRLLPADQNLLRREDNLFTTGNVTPGALASRIGFSMGCHSGVAVADSAVALALQPDWPRTWTGDSATGAGGGLNWMGNTGFGLGDTVAVAYSERLNALFAQRLDGTMTVGQALVFAKQEYAAIPTITGYDLKVIDEAAMYGLPMYRLGSGTATPPAPPASTSIDPATGLAAFTFSVSPSFTLVTTPIGKYYTVGGSASFVDRRPIEPTTQLDVTEPNLVAHGAIVTGATSTEETGFDVAFSHVVDDLSALSPELTGDTIFPSKLQSIATLNTPVGQRQRLALYAGQFRSGSVTAPGIGIQRKFTNLSGSVLFAAPSVTDFSPPAFGPMSVSAADTTVGFAVDVSDANGDSDVMRVFALYRDAGSTWKTAEFSHPVGSSRWSGAGPVTGTNVEWFIQAVDAAGNVGVTSNKATVESLIPPTPGTISADLSGTGPVNGWYRSAVTVTIRAGTSVKYSVDGGAFADYTGPFPVSGTGLHVVAFQGSDGSSGSVTVPIDVTPPTIAIPSSPGTVQIGQTSTSGIFTCTDAGSGIQSCTSTTPSTPSTAADGTTRYISVTATDRVGNTVTNNSVPYRVLYPFRGFLQPLLNLPLLNMVNAGQGAPVKFSLTGNRGLTILAGSPSSQKVNCDLTVPTGDVPTVTAGSSSLSYDAKTDTYTYTWKTDKAWSGTCRQFTMKLADGSTKVAGFKFK